MVRSRPGARLGWAVAALVTALVPLVGAGCAASTTPTSSYSGPTATVSLYAYANPVIAIALGVLLADEPFGARVVIASMMVLTGSALVQWRKKKETAVATNRRHAAA